MGNNGLWVTLIMTVSVMAALWAFLRLVAMAWGMSI